MTKQVDYIINPTAVCSCTIIIEADYPVRLSIAYCEQHQRGFRIARSLDALRQKPALELTAEQIRRAIGEGESFS